jgi:hypothetical protein
MTILRGLNAFQRLPAATLTTTKEIVPNAKEKKYYRMEPVITRLQDAKTSTHKQQYLAENAKADMSKRTINATLK